MDFTVIKVQPNTDENRPLNFDHIPFTKKELYEAHLVKTRLDGDRLFIIRNFIGDELIEIVPVNKNGLPHKRISDVVRYHDIIEIQKLDKFS